MRKKTMKKLVYWGIFVAAVVLLVMSFRNSSTSSYPETVTPKPLLGNPSADVKIVEYADLQCPACRAAHPIIKQIVSEFEEEVSYEFKHFPLTQIHPQAMRAAEASECANDQGKFHEYVDLLFENQQRLFDPDLRNYAEQLDLDSELFNQCLRSGTKVAIVNGDQRQGIALGVRGTPSIFINGKPLSSWQIDAFRQEIMNELEN